jgi:hypothetical protein
MSAVAQIDDGLAVVPELHLAEASGPTLAQIQAKEMNRWMLWFGTPMLVVAILIGFTFATDTMWGLAAAIGVLIVDMGILVYLCMSSDTNGAGAIELPAAAH